MSTSCPPLREQGSPLSARRHSGERRVRLPLYAVVLAAMSSLVGAPPADAQRADSAQHSVDWGRFHRERARLFEGESLLSAAPRRPPRRLSGEEFGSYDLQEIQVTLPLDGIELPREASYRVTLIPTIDSETLFFVSVNWIPDEVSFEGIPLMTRRIEDGVILEVTLPALWPAGVPISLDLRGRLQLSCDPPVLCNERGDFPHLISPGILPLNPEGFERDYFQIELIFQQRGAEALHPMATGAVIERAPERGEWRFRTEERNQLPAFSLHWIEPEPFDELIELSPAMPRGFEVGVGERMRRTVDFYSALYFPFPFSRLGASTISDDVGAALGPQGNIFLPESFWNRDLFEIPELERLITSVIAHEIAHQYFFNSVFITGQGVSWLSEAFAEYSADLFAAADYGDPIGDEANRRVNYWTWVGQVAPEDDLPLASVEIDEDPRRQILVYSKGATILHTLAAQYPSTFEEAMRGYVSDFRGQFTSNEELLESLSVGLGTDLQPFFNLWVFSAGYPTITVESRWRPASEDEPTGGLRLFVESDRPLRELRPLELLGELAIEAPGEERFFDSAILIDSVGPTSIDLPALRSLKVDPTLRFPRKLQGRRGGDVNLSGVVDGLDLLDLHFALRSGLAVPNPRWDPLLDLNEDAQVSGADVEAARERFGDGLPSVEEEPELDE